MRVPHGEYDGIIFAAVAMRDVATITVATCYTQVSMIIITDKLGGGNYTGWRRKQVA